MNFIQRFKSTPHKIVTNYLHSRSIVCTDKFLIKNRSSIDVARWTQSRGVHTSSLHFKELKATNIISSNDVIRNEIFARAAVSGILSERESKTFKFEDKNVILEATAEGFRMKIANDEWKNVKIISKSEGKFELSIDGSSQRLTLAVTPENVTILNDSGQVEFQGDAKFINGLIPAISTSAGGNSTLFYLAAFVIGVQWIAFLHAGGFFGNERTEKYYDLIGSLTFLSTTALSLFLTPHVGLRQVILSSFVAVWAARLGYFLYTRIHNNNGIDSRFENLKKDNFKFWTAWTMQGVWVLTCLFPVLKLSTLSASLPLTSLDYAGFGLWAFGFIFEAVADYQKMKFRENPENKGKFIDSGLWSISRHPNYFGEICLWSGLSLAAYSGTHSPLVFITPAFVSLLLIYISGIPLLEKAANKRFGSDEKYLNYKKKTPVLIPFVGRKGDAEF